MCVCVRGGGGGTGAAAVRRGIARYALGRMEGLNAALGDAVVGDANGLLKTRISWEEFYVIAHDTENQRRRRAEERERTLWHPTSKGCVRRRKKAQHDHTNPNVQREDERKGGRAAAARARDDGGWGVERARPLGGGDVRRARRALGAC